MFPLEREARLCHRGAMATRNPRAGGFFLMAAILIGAVVGIAIGQPSAGMLAGAAIGIAIAVALWLLDRRSR